MLNHIFATFKFSSFTLSSAIALVSVLPISLLSINSAAIAQNSPDSPDSQATTQPVKSTTVANPVISPTKRALIKDLLEITQASKNANLVMDSMVRAELPKLVSTILKAVPSLDSDRPETQKRLSEVASRMAIKYRDRVLQKIDLSQLIEQVSYPIYDKYFTESELRDIIGFYKSETGKKAIGVLPQIMGDSMSRTNDILLPKLSQIMTEIVTEELLNSLPKAK